MRNSVLRQSYEVESDNISVNLRLERNSNINAQSHCFQD